LVACACWLACVCLCVCCLLVVMNRSRTLEPCFCVLPGSSPLESARPGPPAPCLCWGRKNGVVWNQDLDRSERAGVWTDATPFPLARKSSSVITKPTTPPFFGEIADPPHYLLGARTQTYTSTRHIYLTHRKHTRADKANDNRTGHIIANSMVVHKSE
jgi:hypothetical protein